MRYRLGLFSLLVVLAAGAGCVGQAPMEPPKRGFYKGEPARFEAPVDRVWDAAVVAVEELGWSVATMDRERGLIVLKWSYVYNPSFGRYARVYSPPPTKELKHSVIKPYLRKISYYEKTASPTPIFVREKMTIRLKPASEGATMVSIDYVIVPFYDQKIGYLGAVRSRGMVEGKILRRMEEVLGG